MYVGSIGTPAFSYSVSVISAKAQKCGGVQRKINIASASAGAPIVPVTAAQPTSGGTEPAAPPMTMFCEVRRFNHIV